VESRSLVKADDDVLDRVRVDEASDGGVTAGAERLMLVEDLVNEGLEHRSEVAIGNLGD
jgi:hypothetical protein